MKTHNLSDPEKTILSSWVHGLATWKVIAHHTFEWRGVSSDSAAKSYERFMRRALPDVGYFYAIERNPSDRFDPRPGHHIHALWANCDLVERKGIWDKWFTRYGRCRIEPCRSSGDVASYCAKYVTKGDTWWNVRLDRQSWLSLGKKSTQTLRKAFLNRPPLLGG